MLKSNFSFLKKLMTCLVSGLVLSALILLIGNGGNIPWLPPYLIFSFVGMVALSSFVYPIFWHKRSDRFASEDQLIFGKLFHFIHWTIATNLILFGIKKFFGLQFIVPPEIAALPANKMSGEWLTWFYFGYSAAYSMIIACIQIIGSLLLLYKRTSLVGVFILLSVMVNLTLINIFYKMNAGALLQSVFITIGLIFVLLNHFERLKSIFLLSRVISSNSHSAKKYLPTLVLLISCILFTFYLTQLD